MLLSWKWDGWDWMCMGWKPLRGATLRALICDANIRLLCYIFHQALKADPDWLHK